LLASISAGRKRYVPKMEKEKDQKGKETERHELWGGPFNRTRDPEAEDLAELIGDYSLTNTLPPGTITYKESNASSTIDLCLLTVELIDRIIQSGVDQSVKHDSDHLPITTVLDLRVTQLAKKPARN
jgi:endonuclease/exonuclease/phosphatase family metal-dependent hydrolase